MCLMDSDGDYLAIPVFGGGCDRDSRYACILVGFWGTPDIFCLVGIVTRMPYIVVFGGDSDELMTFLCLVWIQMKSPDISLLVGIFIGILLIFLFWVGILTRNPIFISLKWWDSDRKSNIPVLVRFWQGISWYYCFWWEFWQTFNRDSPDSHIWWGILKGTPRIM